MDSNPTILLCLRLLPKRGSTVTDHLINVLSQAGVGELCSGAWQNKLAFCGYPYKMPIHARVENYLNVMLNAQIYPQLLALMWEASP